MSKTLTSSDFAITRQVDLARPQTGRPATAKGADAVGHKVARVQKQSARKPAAMQTRPASADRLQAARPEPKKHFFAPALMTLKLAAAQGQLPPEQEADFRSLLSYTATAEKGLEQLAALGAKLEQGQTLTPAEQKKFAALAHQHKENLPILLEGAERLANASGAENLRHLAGDISNRLADMHMGLADLFARHDEFIPDRPALTRTERSQFHQMQIKAMSHALDRLAASAEHLKMDPDEKNHVRASCRQLKDVFAKHGTRLQKFHDQPSGEGRVFAETLAMPISKQGTMTQTQRSQLDAQWQGDFIETPPTLSLPGPDTPTQAELMEHYALSYMAKRGVPVDKLPSLAQLYKESVSDALGAEDWSPIETQFAATIGDEKLEFRSRISPAGEHSDRLRTPYAQGGVPASQRTQSDHAVNLAKSELFNDKGEVLYRGQRMGVLDSYDINEKTLGRMSDAELHATLDKLLVKTGLATNPKKAATLRAHTEATLRREGITPQTLSGPDGATLRRELDKIIAQTGSAQTGADALVKAFRGSSSARKKIASAAREGASRYMARDLAETLIAADPKLYQRALEGKEVNLPISSLSLMTPDALRKGRKSERKMLEIQQKALTQLASFQKPGRPLILNVRDPQGRLRPVRVNLQVRQFNFGVNAGALRGAGKLSRNPSLWRRLMGWGFAAKTNDPQLTQLLGKKGPDGPAGDVGIMLGRLHSETEAMKKTLAKTAPSDPNYDRLTTAIHAHETRTENILELAKQVRQLWHERRYTTQGREPYKMVSRLGMLLHEMGEIPLANCRSGKDRTGQYDAEVKYVAAFMDRTGQPPPLDAPPTDTTRKARTQFLLHTGNRELQRLNTGLPGYKLSLPRLNDQMEAHALPAFRGGSAYVST